MTRTRAAAAVAVLGLLLGATACGGDDSSSTSSTTAASGSTATTAAPTSTTSGGSTTTTSSSAGGSTTTLAGGSNAALYAARTDLRASIKSLASVAIIKDGVAGLTQPLAAIKADVQQIQGAAQGDVKPQADALGASLQKLDTTLQDRSTAGLLAIASAASGVVTSANVLLSSLDALKCN